MRPYRHLALAFALTVLVVVVGFGLLVWYAPNLPSRAEVTQMRVVLETLKAP